MNEQWGEVGRFLLSQFGDLLVYIAGWSLLAAWLAWWLWGVNWNRAWPFLREGAWVPLLLIGVLAALVWSQLAPSSQELLGIVAITNFWWQLTAVGTLIGSALVCGWLQGYFGWAPDEIDLEPPAAAHGDH